MKTTSNEQLPSQRLLAWLGWQHRGYRFPSRRRAALLLGLLLALPLIGDVREILNPNAPARPDIDRWLRTAATLQADPAAHIYQVHTDYLYPPYFLSFFRLLNNLPPRYAALVYELVKWAALVTALWLTWRLCTPVDEDAPPLVALGSIILTGRFFTNDLGNGNVNIFMLFLIVTACWALRRGWHISAGFLVAVGACTKVTPALVLVYFLYKRCWRTLIGAALAGIICLIVYPSLWIGWENNWRLLWEWYDHIIGPYASHGAVYSIHSNQSFTGVINRLLGPYKALEPDIHIAPVVLAEFWRNVLRWSLSAGLLATLAWTCRGGLNAPKRGPGAQNRDETTHPRRILALPAEIGLVLVAMLALSGYTWKMHFVTMIVPVSALLAYLADARTPRRSRRPLWLILAIVTVLFILSGDGLLGPRGADYAEAVGVFLLGALLLGLAMVLVRRSIRLATTCDARES